MSLEKFREAVDKICRERGETTLCTVWDGDDLRSFSYFRIYREIREFDRVIRRFELNAGDRIAVVSRSGFLSFLLFNQAAYHGLTAAIIDPSLPRELLTDYLSQCQVKAVFSDRDIYENDLTGIGEPVMEMGDGYPPLKDGKAESGILPGDADCCAVLFSSGTSGENKPVLLTYDALLYNRYANAHFGGIRKSDNYFCAFPLFHISGLFSSEAIFLTGAALSFVGGFRPEKTAFYLNTLNPTIFGMIPEVVKTVVQNGEGALKSKSKTTFFLYRAAASVSLFFRRNLHIRGIGKILMRPFSRKMFGKKMHIILVGGTKCGKNLARDIQKLGFVYFNSYSSTECGCPIVATTRFDPYVEDGEGRCDSIDGVKVILTDKDENGVGEIRVKSPMMMKGYFNRPDLTKSSFDENGYFMT